ncbi:hypothetical protein OF83DRAFT_1089726 [Amylostereum chailletii]|nr:hypothetical protein OF83DRAFT_1089726 [Amylostereum chailletii]
MLAETFSPKTHLLGLSDDFASWFVTALASIGVRDGGKEQPAAPELDDEPAEVLAWPPEHKACEMGEVKVAGVGQADGNVEDMLDPSDGVAGDEIAGEGLGKRDRKCDVMR